MNVTDVANLVDRAEKAIAKIEVVSQAIQRCQAHCWVGEDRRKEWRRRGVT